MKNEKYITCKLIGPSELGGIHNFGLGNQMFQIATAISYAKKNNLIATFPDLRDKKFGGYSNNIFKKIITDNFDYESLEVEYYEPSFLYNKIPSFENIRIHGYFQSEKYFIDSKKIIKDVFDVDPVVHSYIYKKYGNKFFDATSCHFRFGDYTKLDDYHLSLTKTSYYQDALKKINNKKLVIFSDDISRCKQLNIFKDFDVSYVSGETDVVDLYMMSMCKDNIIANSTFSWWGAWLNKNKEKNIYYPGKWFGEKNPLPMDSLIPDDWIPVPI
jgi:hypothetical protein